jgi:hypothetical protein
VRITTVHGRRYDIERVEPKWDGAAPPSDEEIIAKFRDLSAVLPVERSRQIEHTVLSLEDVPDATLLLDVLVRP